MERIRLDTHIDTLHTLDHVVIAEIDAGLVGVAALSFEQWNHRAALWHFYVASTYRGQGVGRALMDDVVRVAQKHQARCLWLETQNINYGAIQFYRRMGFHCCGLDQSLYDPEGVTAGETALFFLRQFP
jgi:ribosomal protein S18 acetylase RimI-like enzyme